MNNEILCDFQKIDVNPNLYKCSNCGIIKQKKDLNHRFICAKKINNLSKDTNNKFNVKLLSKETIPSPKQVIRSENQCSQEQIDSRLSVCKSCEFYQNNTCLKCGCSLSRDRVFMNKLYWPDQSCPIGKWGPAEPENIGE